MLLPRNSCFPSSQRLLIFSPSLFVSKLAVQSHRWVEKVTLTTSIICTSHSCRKKPDLALMQGANFMIRETRHIHSFLRVSVWFIRGSSVKFHCRLSPPYCCCHGNKSSELLRDSGLMRSSCCSCSFCSALKWVQWSRFLSLQRDIQRKGAAQRCVIFFCWQYKLYYSCWEVWTWHSLKHQKLISALVVQQQINVNKSPYLEISAAMGKDTLSHTESIHPVLEEFTILLFASLFDR